MRTSTQGWSMMMIALLASLFAGSAWAQPQPDCSRVPEQYRATCEQGMKVKAACAGLQGEARKHCMERHIDYGAAKENCMALAGEARLQCMQHNRIMDVAAPCKGKAGPELEACIKAQATMRAK